MAGALSDLKIVELGELVGAPYASKLMADMGAEVIKIERPVIGDRARMRGPFPKDESHPEKSGLFLYLNTNKLGVTLDVATADGFQIFEKLIAT
jgi:crotonobetainyl-CoA:carnitine CoA-transferase CaiB-like acyl-CoA transferase